MIMCQLHVIYEVSHTVLVKAPNSPFILLEKKALPRCLSQIKERKKERPDNITG